MNLVTIMEKALFGLTVTDVRHLAYAEMTIPHRFQNTSKKDWDAGFGSQRHKKLQEKMDSIVIGLPHSGWSTANAENERSRNFRCSKACQCSGNKVIKNCGKMTPVFIFFFKKKVFLRSFE